MHNFILGLANIALADERVFSVPSVFDAEKELKPLKLGKNRQILLCLMLISKLRMNCFLLIAQNITPSSNVLQIELWLSLINQIVN